MRVFIIDDSALVRSIVKQILSEAPDMELAGEASNGKAGAEAVEKIKPDLVLLDVNMPIMNGIEATKAIMASYPVPIIIFSTSVDADVSFQACNAGAVDVMTKPDIGQYNDPQFLNEFYSKLRMLGSGKGIKKSEVTAPDFSSLRKDEVSDTANQQKSILRGFNPAMIVMGASTGGPKAVRTILSMLPSDLPVPVALVQHLETGFDQGYCDWLNELSALKVILVHEKMDCKPGYVYLAPNDRHIILKKGPVIMPDDGDKVLNQKPAVDVLFKSAAAAYGSEIAGVLLTGMGSDGAAGCLSIIEQGGITLVQDQATSAIYGMPKEAVRLGAATQVLPLDEIPAVMKKVAAG